MPDDQDAPAFPRPQWSRRRILSRDAEQGRQQPVEAEQPAAPADGEGQP